MTDAGDRPSSSGGAGPQPSDALDELDRALLVCLREAAARRRVEAERRTLPALRAGPGRLRPVDPIAIALAAGIREIAARRATEQAERREAIKPGPRRKE